MPTILNKRKKSMQLKGKLQILLFSYVTWIKTKDSTYRTFESSIS